MISEIGLLCCFGGIILTVKHISAYENIALNKPAWQQFPYHGHLWGADKAVDGRYSNRTYIGGQCTISENEKQTATWWVDLGGIFSIHHITIYYRTDDVTWETGHSSRFLGFSVFISNTTRKDEGILCFKDTNYTRGTIPDTFTIECVTHGRYIIYYNERLPGVIYPDAFSQYAYNDLCEVEVYGCTTSGFYGNNCGLPCPQNCQEGRCNIVNGYCLGCITGLKGPRCEERCENDKYGLDCSLYCGNCSNREQCNHVNGSCPNGCDVGVQGDTCVEACPFGRHGKNCDEFCNPNCRGGCNRFTGVCESGCYPGWKGYVCERECDGWRYGKDCNISCGSCLSFEQCYHINGTCLNGCERGFQGEKCNEACPEEHYGFDCQDTCSINCGVPGRCNRATGECQRGCQAGWKGTKCDKKCDGGTFGLNCNKTCGVCLDKKECHHVNGICLNKCDKGYQGIYCTQECPNGLYGYNCQETCSANCLVQKTCDSITGQCSAISSSPDTNSLIHASLYGVIISLCLSVALNIILLIWVCRNRASKGMSQEENNTKPLPTELTTPNTGIYDKVEENAGYKELGQLSQPSLYDKLN